MTPGILAWDLVTPRRPWPSLDAAAGALGQALAAALASLGFAAAFRPPGEVALAGRKVAGLAGAFEGPTLLHQGSLLVEADLAELAGLLGRPTLPMTTLAAFGPVPEPHAIAAALATAFAEALGAEALAA
jgi:lipoate-protein ligase A